MLASYSVVICDWCGVWHMAAYWIPVAVTRPLISATPDITAMPVKASQNQAQ